MHDGRTVAEPPSPTREPTPDPGPVRAERLLVLMDDGNVVTAGTDGRDVRSLIDYPPARARGPTPGLVARRRSVAWAELEIGDQGASSRIVTTEPDGSGRTEFPVDTGAFFLQWDPTSSRIAYLGNFQGSVGMGVAGRARRGSRRDDARGRTTLLPLLVAGGPGAVGPRRDADPRALWISKGAPLIGDAPGIFQAPVWLADGRMFYARLRSGQSLVVRDGGARVSWSSSRARSSSS